MVRGSWVHRVPALELLLPPQPSQPSLHPRGTLSLPHENSFPVVIFPVSIIIPLLELENKQLKEKGKKKQTVLFLWILFNRWGGCGGDGCELLGGKCPRNLGIFGVSKNWCCPFFSTFSGEPVKGQQSTIWKCLPGGCSLGVSAVFPAREVCPDAFFPHPPVYSFGRGFPGGQLGGWRSHLCPLTEGEERTEI